MGKAETGSLLVRLQGNLSAELGSSLYLQVKENPANPLLVCLDGNQVSRVDEIGASYLEKIRDFVGDSGEPRFHLAWFSENAPLATAETSLFPDGIPIFATEREAKLHLESLVQSRPLVQGKDPESPQPEYKFRGSEPRRAFCPACYQELSVKAVGDYSCPNCGTKFHYDSKGRTKAYERLF